MRIVLQPRIDLFSKQVFVEVPALNMPADGSDQIKIGALAAKTCYNSFELDKQRPNETNQRHIKEERHGRILEHVVYGVLIRGISRACGNELITHKPGFTVSQESTRFVDKTNAGYVLEPYLAELVERLLGEGKLTRQNLRDPLTIPVHPNVAAYEGNELMLVRGQLIAAQSSFSIYETQYERLVAQNPKNLTGTKLRKWARGKARNVLPLGLETAIAMTGNVRAWRNFIEMRCAAGAEEEIRRMSFMIYETLHAAEPIYFEDYRLGEERWTLETDLRKV